MISVKTQNVHTNRKRIQKPTLRGSTYLVQENGTINIAASVDHQSICQDVLGKPNRHNSLDSYISWGDVSAEDIVELIYRIDAYK